MKKGRLTIIMMLTLLVPLMLIAPVRAIQVPDELKRTVAFIFVEDSPGHLAPYGTGFFVGVREPPPKDMIWVYLATAKHVVQDGNARFLPRVFVRLNTKSGGSEFLRLDLKTNGSDTNVFIHQDKSVDIAVVPALPDQGKYDYKVIPNEYLTTKKDFKDLNISEGTQVFFTGLFTHHFGLERNHPIVRVGSVALISDEKIDFNGTGADLYLMESTSFGGNSGSPVFFYLGEDRIVGGLTVGPPIIKLAGVIMGYFNELGKIGIMQAGKVPFTTLNSGISAVTPAYKLHEILYGDALKSQRELLSKLQK